jgi:hypothetical protein
MLATWEPLEEGADEKYAEVRTALERAGTLIGANDLLIATQALLLGLALVTDNAGEFSRVPGLGVEKLAGTLTPRRIEIVRPASQRQRSGEQDTCDPL